MRVLSKDARKYLGYGITASARRSFSWMCWREYGIIIGLIYRMYIDPIDYQHHYEYLRNIAIEITPKSPGRIIMQEWFPGGRVLTFTLNRNPHSQQKLKRLTPAAIPHMNKGQKLQTGETIGDDVVE